MTSILLGSSSPRRKEILSYFNLPFKTASPTFDENSIPFNGDPITYAQEIAHNKALSLSPLHPEDTILTADTIVYLKPNVYGKPRTREEAIKMLSSLSGKTHTVFTAISLSTKGKMLHAIESTDVTFHSLNDQQLHLYLDHIKWSDKAGSYAIQDAGALLVKKIDGCFYNVMGLPIQSVAKLLNEVGIDLWNFLK